MDENFKVIPIDVTAEKIEKIVKMDINDISVDENSDNSSFPTSKVVNEAIKSGTANLLPLDVETEWIFDGGTAETTIEPKFVIDNEPSTTSPNAVKNNAITKYVNDKVKSVSEKTNKLEEKYENLQIAPAIESKENPNCYFRIVDGVTEWINPPTATTVQYRTTERWSGKVVYTQLINCGLSADKKTITMPTNTGIVRYAGKIGGQLIPTITGNDLNHAWSASISVGTTSAVLYCGSALTGLPTYLQIWYIKGDA